MARKRIAWALWKSADGLTVAELLALECGGWFRRKLWRRRVERDIARMTADHLIRADADGRLRLTDIGERAYID